METLLKLLDEVILNDSDAADKNAAISEAFKTIGSIYKLDLRTVQEIGGNLEFVYKVENTDPAVYITGTAAKSPRVWVNIAYIII